MGRFKSGIILKTRCVVAESVNESHTDLLDKLNIEDSKENAMTKFVRVELVPLKNEWWTNPKTWEINVDQDITPDWFDIDQEKYLNEFRNAVIAWWEEHVLVDREIEELNSGYYRLKRCKVKRLCKDVRVMCDSSSVGKMRGSSSVGEMRGSSSVGVMYDSSTVGEMYGSSTVGEMHGSSTVGVMYDSSSVGVMYDSSTVGEMYGSSTVGEMHGSSTVGVMYDSSSVGVMYDSSTVGDMREDM